MRFFRRQGQPFGLERGFGRRQPGNIHALNALYSQTQSSSKSD
jgi:hypothetical protein